jgi:hypothetical protein
MDDEQQEKSAPSLNPRMQITADLDSILVDDVGDDAAALQIWNDLNVPHVDIGVHHNFDTSHS